MNKAPTLPFLKQGNIGTFIFKQCLEAIIQLHAKKIGMAFEICLS